MVVASSSSFGDPTLRILSANQSWQWLLWCDKANRQTRECVALVFAHVKRR